MNTIVSADAPPSNTLQEYEVGCQGMLMSKLVLFGSFVPLGPSAMFLERELGLTHR